MKKYIFNENDVCTNPDKIGEGFVSGNFLYNYIEVAQHPANKLWGFGLYMNHLFDQTEAGGSFVGVSKERCEYQTKERAIYAACQYLKKTADEQDTQQTYHYYPIDKITGHSIPKPATTKKLRIFIKKILQDTQPTLF